MRLVLRLFGVVALVLGLGVPAFAQPFFFTTGDTDGLIAVASRPASADGSKAAIEAADDFILSSQTLLYGAIFDCLLPIGITLDDIGNVTVEICRVFPDDSDSTRTPLVPMRTDSPADGAFDRRSNQNAPGSGSLAFAFIVLEPHHTIQNSVINNIYPPLALNTGGEGPVTAWLAQFVVLFTDEFILPADHYFIVPQVEVLNGLGNFYWLSAPYPQFSGDSESWVRNADLQPDWLRVGSDIISGTMFNGSFSLFGETFPGQ